MARKTRWAAALAVTTVVGAIGCRSLAAFVSVPVQRADRSSHDRFQAASRICLGKASAEFASTSPHHMAARPSPMKAVESDIRGSRSHIARKAEAGDAAGLQARLPEADPPLDPMVDNKKAYMEQEARKLGTVEKPPEKKMVGWPRPGEERTLGYRIRGAPGRPGSPHHWTERIRWCSKFKRRIHIRRKLEGTCARPRMAVFQSHRHLNVNVVDDTVGLGIVLVHAATTQKEVQQEILKLDKVGVKGSSTTPRTWTLEAAEALGKILAQRCFEKNITAICFDRGGNHYDGRVKALAESARSSGLLF